MPDKKKSIPYDLNKIAAAFDIKRKRKCEHLNKWINTTFDLSENEQVMLDKLYQKMEGNVDYWNEEELKMQMVSILFFLADIDVEEQIKVFYERSIAATINDYELAVKCDCMVATPTEFNAPKRPYFFLQEFKKEKGDKNAPEAQMLQAMIIAQTLNQDDKPVYGGYLVGSRWRFSTLIAKNYCISQHFDADTQPELVQLVYILKQLKNLILNR